MASKEKDQKQIEVARGMKHIPWCEQYERMISGMLYDAFVPELANNRFGARRWCHKYNNYFPTAPEADFDSLQKERMQFFKEIIGELRSEDIFIEPPFNVDYGCNIRLGDRFYANFNLVILDCAIVTIGDRVMFGPNVSILTATHEVEVQSRRDNIEYALPITIGDDCWIGANTVVLPGITIGQGCTIGANSTVTTDIPPWSVAVGSPARVIKKVKPLEE